MSIEVWDSYYTERWDEDRLLELHCRRDHLPDRWNESCCRYESVYGPWEYGYSIRSGISLLPVDGHSMQRVSEIIWGYIQPETARNTGRIALAEASS